MNKRFFQDLSAEMKGISIEDLLFIDRSFRRWGNSPGSGFGDFSVGLEGVSKVASISVRPLEKDFLVVLYGKSGVWEFGVTIDGETGAWKNPWQAEIAPEPDLEPELDPGSGMKTESD